MAVATIEKPRPAPPRKRRRRWLIRFAVAFCGAAGIAWFMLPHCLARAIVYAPNHGKDNSQLSHAHSAEPLPPEVTQALRIPVGPPSAELAVWVLRSDSANEMAPTVFVLHGMLDSKGTMLGLGRSLKHRGFQAVLVDLRGHGESTGDWLTFGFVEKRDLSQVLDYLIDKGLTRPSVGVIGASMGASVAIQWAGLDPRVRAVVAVAPFSTMRQVVPISVRACLPGGRWLSDPWIDRIITQSGRLAGFDPDEASPLAAIRQTQARVLLIHGQRDEKIPIVQSEELQAASPQTTRLIRLEDEDHNSITGDRSGAIDRDGMEWLERWLQIE